MSKPIQTIQDIPSFLEDKFCNYFMDSKFSIEDDDASCFYCHSAFSSGSIYSGDMNKYSDFDIDFLVNPNVYNALEEYKDNPELYKEHYGSIEFNKIKDIETEINTLEDKLNEDLEKINADLGCKVKAQIWVRDKNSINPKNIDAFKSGAIGRSKKQINNWRGLASKFLFSYIWNCHKILMGYDVFEEFEDLPKINIPRYEAFELFLIYTRYTLSSLADILKNKDDDEKREEAVAELSKAICRMAHSYYIASTDIVIPKKNLIELEKECTRYLFRPEEFHSHADLFQEALSIKRGTIPEKIPKTHLFNFGKDLKIDQEILERVVNYVNTLRSAINFKLSEINENKHHNYEKVKEYFRTTLIELADDLLVISNSKLEITSIAAFYISELSGFLRNYSQNLSKVEKTKLLDLLERGMKGLLNAQENTKQKVEAEESPFPKEKAQSDYNDIVLSLAHAQITLAEVVEDKIKAEAYNINAYSALTILSKEIKPNNFNTFNTKAETFLELIYLTKNKKEKVKHIQNYLIHGKNEPEIWNELSKLGIRFNKKQILRKRKKTISKIIKQELKKIKQHRKKFSKYIYYETKQKKEEYESYSSAKEKLHEDLISNLKSIVQAITCEIKEIRKVNSILYAAKDNLQISMGITKYVSTLRRYNVTLDRLQSEMYDISKDLQR